MASTYATLGGEPAVRAAVDAFYRTVVGDGALAAYFADVDVDELKAHQRAFLAVALGGPGRYTGRSMREAHAGIRITDAAFDRVVEHLVATLDGLGVDAATCADIGRRLAPLRPEIVTG